MTEKQHKFILRLLDDCGYNTKEIKEKFFDKFFKYDNPDIGYVSSIIERLN